MVEAVAGRGGAAPGRWSRRAGRGGWRGGRDPPSRPAVAGRSWPRSARETRGGERTGPTGAVMQTVDAELEVAVPPLRRASTGDAHGRGHVGDRRARLDAPAQQQSTLRGQRSVTVNHEDLRVGVSLRQLHTYSRRSSRWWTPTASPTSVRGTTVGLHDVDLVPGGVGERTVSSSFTVRVKAAPLTVVTVSPSRVKTSEVWYFALDDVVGEDVGEIAGGVSQERVERARREGCEVTGDRIRRPPSPSVAGAERARSLEDASACFSGRAWGVATLRVQRRPRLTASLPTPRTSGRHRPAVDPASCLPFDGFQRSTGRMYRQGTSPDL